MRQGDSLSPLLFASFINDLGQQLNALNIGIDIGGGKLNLLVYADDIVCIAPDEKSAQKQMDILSSWCSTWGMYVNIKKTQVVHVRHHQKPCNKTKLTCMGAQLEYTRLYKYLGYHIQEHLNHADTVAILMKSAKRAFGRVVNTFYKLKNMGFNTYKTLHESGVLSIVNYTSGVWGYKEYQEPRVFLNRCSCFFPRNSYFHPTGGS